MTDMEGITRGPFRLMSWDEAQRNAARARQGGPMTVDPSTFGCIPAPQAMILWDDRQGVGITDVAVCRQEDRENHDRHRFGCSRGVCDWSWLDGDPLNSPMGVFLWMSTVDRFHSPEVEIRALAEMAKISEQRWAITLLKVKGALAAEF
ncbi:hypothetical protein [Inquilinus limosus]|uniref:Uncharacterized protein n=1 Tax=Inquilinus limosus TaxID=171674 RepID=A0A211ZQH0_9PROT|nr:hypothetical protein [Inquilinus limosus]OWJ67434.1 hypothetical protein BWR60_09515 [Inquilinus limosus]